MKTRIEIERLIKTNALYLLAFARLMQLLDGEDNLTVSKAELLKRLPKDDSELNRLFDDVDKIVNPKLNNSFDQDDVTRHQRHTKQVYVTGLTIYPEEMTRVTRLRKTERKVHGAIVVAGKHPEFGANFNGIIEVTTIQLNSILNLSLAKRLKSDKPNFSEWNKLKGYIANKVENTGKGIVANASYTKYEIGDTFINAEGELDKVQTEYISVGVATVSIEPIAFSQYSKAFDTEFSGVGVEAEPIIAE